jgi:hypothetical protein
MEDQIYWLCLSEFHVNYKVNVNNVSAMPEGAVGRGIDKFFDGDLSTYYNPVRVPQSGEAVNINIKSLQATKLEIYQRTVSGAEVCACSRMAAKRKSASWIKIILRQKSRKTRLL